MSMQVSRRKFLGLAAGALGGMALAACQPAAAPAPQAGEAEAEPGAGAAVPAAEPIELTVWGFVSLIYEQVYDTFEEQHPGVTVNLSELGENVFGDQKFLTAVAAGTGPDVAVQNRHTFLQFAARNLYQDVTPRFEASGLNRDDFTPVQLEESSWEGKIYGLPMFTDVRYLYWNPDHYAEVGLDPAQPPTTWTELEAYADRLNVRSDDGDVDRYGFVPYLFGNSWMWLYGFLNKAPAISEDKRTILCDDPRWVETLDWMVNFYDNYVGDFQLANSFSEAVQSAGLGQPFAAQKTSMDANGNWFVQDLLRNPDVNWDAAPMPIPDGGEKSTWSCGYSLVMAPSAKSPDQAWELMRWVTVEEGWEAKAAAVLIDVERVWQREQIEGDPQYWPELACYIPALTMLEEKYVSQLGEREQRTWDLSVDALENWTHGCGSEMGVAALEYWVEMDNAARSALSHQLTSEEAMLQCKEKVQTATDRAWESIESA